MLKRVQKNLRKDIDSFEATNKSLVEDNNNLKREIKSIKEDNEIVIQRKDLEVDVKVSQSTKVLVESNQKLLLENGNLKKEVEILTKAFENMGFDVKDMKEILNKLVDGIVSKNTIQLVK